VALFGPFVPWLRAAGGEGRGGKGVPRPWGQWGQGFGGIGRAVCVGSRMVNKDHSGCCGPGQFGRWGRRFARHWWSHHRAGWCGSAGREWPFLGPQWRRCSEAIMHGAGGNKRVGVDCCFLWDPKNRADHGPSSSWSVRSPRRRNNEMVALSLSRPQLTTDAVCPSRHPSSGPVGQVRARNGATRHPIALLGVLPSRMCKHIPRRRLSSVQLVDLGASRSRYYDRHLIVLGRYEGCADSNVVAMIEGWNC